MRTLMKRRWFSPSAPTRLGKRADDASPAPTAAAAAHPERRRAVQPTARREHRKYVKDIQGTRCATQEGNRDDEAISHDPSGRGPPLGRKLRDLSRGSTGGGLS